MFIQSIKQTTFERVIKILSVVAIVFGSVAFFSHTLSMVPDADTLFAYRYITALLSAEEVKLIVQPGSRIFPEWFYSFLIVLFTSNPSVWSDAMLLVNGFLLLGTLSYLIRSLVTIDVISSALIAMLMLLVFPLMSSVVPNYLRYYLFMHGTHAFYLPYVLFVMGYFFNSFNARQYSKLKHGLVALLLSLLLASNALMKVVLLAPLLLLTAYLYLFGADQKRATPPLFLVLISALILSYFWLMILGLLSDHVILLNNEFDMFAVGLKEWFINSKLMTQLFDIEKAAVWGYVLVLTAITGLFTFCIKIKKMSKYSQVFGLFYLMSLGLFLGAVWITDKGHIRYMVFLIFLTPLAITVLFSKQWFKSHLKPYLVGVVLLVSLVIIVAGEAPSIAEQKKFKHGLADINLQLNNIKTSHGLTTDGLSDYWLGQSFIDSNTVILPVNRGRQGSQLQPSIWAINLKSFWQYDDGIINQREFSFVVNYKFIDKRNWKINEHVMIDTFGMYEDTAIFSQGQYDYKVYIYPQGIADHALYQRLNNYLKQ